MRKKHETNKVMQQAKLAGYSLFILLGGIGNSHVALANESSHKAPSLQGAISSQREIRQNQSAQTSLGQETAAEGLNSTNGLAESFGSLFGRVGRFLDGIEGSSLGQAKHAGTSRNRIYNPNSREAESIIISGTNQNISLNRSGGKKIIISGTNCRVKLTGPVDLVLISGEANQVETSGAEKVVISGNGNSLILKGAQGSTRVVDSGSANSVIDNYATE